MAYEGEKKEPETWLYVIPVVIEGRVSRAWLLLALRRDNEARSSWQRSGGKKRDKYPIKGRVE